MSRRRDRWKSNFFGRVGATTRKGNGALTFIGAGGSVRLSSYDLGPSLKERSDDADEYHINVPATAAPKLVFASLREKYLGRRDAVQEFRELCEKEGIELWW
jgi:hypothetical protein